MQANLSDHSVMVANKNNGQTERAKEILSIISWTVWRCSLLYISSFHLLEFLSITVPRCPDETEPSPHIACPVRGQKLFVCPKYCISRTVFV